MTQYFLGDLGAEAAFLAAVRAERGDPPARHLQRPDVRPAAPRDALSPGASAVVGGRGCPPRPLPDGAGPLAGRVADCRLTTLEAAILALDRDDDLPGAMMPQLYFRYLRYADPRPLPRIFAHNRWDLVALAALAARAEGLLGGPDPRHDPLEWWGAARWLERRDAGPERPVLRGGPGRAPAGRPRGARGLAARPALATRGARRGRARPVGGSRGRRPGAAAGPAGGLCEALRARRPRLRGRPRYTRVALAATEAAGRGRISSTRSPPRPAAHAATGAPRRPPRPARRRDPRPDAAPAPAGGRYRPRRMGTPRRGAGSPRRAPAPQRVERRRRLDRVHARAGGQSQPVELLGAEELAADHHDSPSGCGMNRCRRVGS